MNATTKKFARRDKRKTKIQKIETNYLAPDTAYEILQALILLEKWIGNAWSAAGNLEMHIDDVIKNHKDEAKKLFVKGLNIERSSRDVRIIKAVEAHEAYIDMLTWYGITTLTEYLDKNGSSINDIEITFDSNFNFKWLNMGGQIISEKKLSVLIEKIKSGILKSWTEIHEEYLKIYSEYEKDKLENAYAVLCKINGVSRIEKDLWNKLLEKAIKIRAYIEEQIFYTKNKDYKNRFRDIVYRNNEERHAVLGRVEDNSLIIESKEETQKFIELFNRCKL